MLRAVPAGGLALSCWKDCIGIGLGSLDLINIAT